MALSVKIEKRLSNFTLKVDFEAQDGVTAILGASGSGKSMTLKCIAGIERPDSGKIVLDGVTLFDSAKKINLPVQKRRVGYLFQEYALFPNMTVRQNIVCGVRERDKAKRDEAVENIIKAMRLTGLEDKRPAVLSGGEKQRTALARILVNEPELLLLDEPFSALDSHLRTGLEEEVRNVAASFGKPVLLVTHNRDEAYRLSQSIAVMHQGLVECIGPRDKIFASPQTVNAAILTGCENISRIKYIDSSHIEALDWGISLETAQDFGGADCVGIRSGDILPDGGKYCFDISGTVENPFSYTLLANPGGGDKAIRIDIDKTEKKADYNKICVSIPPEKLIRLKTTD